MKHFIMRVYFISILSFLILIGICWCNNYASDMDTNSVEYLRIYTEFEFGFPKIEEVYSTVHYKSRNVWYIKGLKEDYFRTKQPVVLFRFKRKNIYVIK